MTMDGQYTRLSSKAEKMHAPVLLKLQAALVYPIARARVKRYILEKPIKVVRLSLGELSAASKSGQATIIRLCRELGYKGFTDFKRALSTENRQRESDLGVCSTAILLDETVSMVSRSVMNTRQLLQPKVIASIAPRLAKAPHVNIYGSGDSGPSAQVLFHRLRRTGVNAHVFANVGYAHKAAEAMSEVDAAIGVFESSVSPDTLGFLRKAHRIGAFSVAITCSPKSGIAKVSNAVLQIARLPRPGLSPQLIGLPRVVFLAEALAISISEHAESEGTTPAPVYDRGHNL